MLIANPVREFLPPSWWNRGHDYFAYGTEWNPLAASEQNAPRQIQIDADSDFLALAVTRVITTAADNTVELADAPQLIRVQDSASGANWMSGLLHIDTFAGHMSGTVGGQGVKWLEVPRLVIRSSTLTVELSNLAATAYRVWIVFHGCKVFSRIRE